MRDLRRTLARWILLDGSRHAVAALQVAVAFALLVALGSVGVIDVADYDAVRGVAGGFVPGLVAFLSIVLGINQLVLSQEFGSAGEVRDRVEDVREYRHDVEDLAGTRPSPVLPTGFLAFVVHTVESEAAALADSVRPDSGDAGYAVREYATAVAAEAGEAAASLEQVRPGRVNALLPVLAYDDAHQLYEARRLRHGHGDALPAETRRALSRLIAALELFSVARTQFRTTYTQRVLARLSRKLLYVGLPALVVVIVLGLLAPPQPAGPLRLVAVSALLSAALSPLAVLSAYLLRVAVVSERTIAVGPFVSRPGADRERETRGPERRPTGRVDPLDDAGDSDE